MFSASRMAIDISKCRETRSTEMVGNHEAISLTDDNRQHIRDDHGKAESGKIHGKSARLSPGYVRLLTDCTADTVYEVIITNGKGYGLFATQSIPRGTRIIEESALITSSPSPASHDLPDVSIEDLTKKLDSLSQKQHELYFDLYHDPKAAAEAKESLRQCQGKQKQSTIDVPFSTTHELESIVKLYAIYQTNFVRLGDDEDCGTGVFPLISRMNHSCVPNVQIYYIPESNKVIAHAVRHINKGEELTINYSSKVCKTQKQRDAVLSRRGFECKCRVCTSTGRKAAASEERRRRMLEINFELATFDEPDSFFLFFFAPPSTPQQAVDLAEELLELFKAEGIADRALQSSYRLCSKYSLKAGLFDKAVAYARKERDVERYYIGADTADLPHLEVDLKGAVPWLNFVLRERQAEVNKQKAAERWLKEEIARETAEKTATKSSKSKKKKK